MYVFIGHLTKLYESHYELGRVGMETVVACFKVPTLHSHLKN
jgi:hypothetical protein